MPEHLDETQWDPDGDRNRPKLVEWIKRMKGQKAADAGPLSEPSTMVRISENPAEAAEADQPEEAR
jgi:hypothetical protein